MAIISTISYNSPVGELILGSFNNALCLADWKFRKQRNSIDQRLQNKLNATFENGTSSIIEQTEYQLNQYFTGRLTTFDIPLLLVGTEFQKSVWNALIEIPFGNTETYLGLSIKLGNEKAIRAVASANGANAISILVPCHRIIGSNGDLVGYAGGLQAKKKLLDLEGYSNTNQLSMF